MLRCAGGVGGERVEALLPIFFQHDRQDFSRAVANFGVGIGQRLQQFIFGGHARGAQRLSGVLPGAIRRISQLPHQVGNLLGSVFGSVRRISGIKRGAGEDQNQSQNGEQIGKVPAETAAACSAADPIASDVPSRVAPPLKTAWVGEIHCSSLRTTRYFFRVLVTRIRRNPGRPLASSNGCIHSAIAGGPTFGGTFSPCRTAAGRLKSAASGFAAACSQ